MLVGHVDRAESTGVAGWAADSDRPDDSVDVVVYVNGRRLARVSCDRFREDLRAAGKYGDGRHAFSFQFPQPLSVELVRRIEVRFAQTGSVLPEGSREFSHVADLTPILVTAPGRSGTTLMMHRLSQSSQICLAETSPYEVRHLAYWSGVFTSLSGPADFDKSTHPDRLEGDGVTIGSNPFRDKKYDSVFERVDRASEYFETFVPRLLADSSREIILEYYFRLRDDQGKTTARFFAEKSNNLEAKCRSFTRTLFPQFREIVLIRDPRDLLCSRLAYFHQDQERAFGQMTHACSQLLALHRAAHPLQHFIKYETLLDNDSDSFERLSQFLDIDDLARGDSEREAAVFSVHATSASPSDSVGRWKRQLDASLISRCDAAWEEFLTEFGYRE